MSTSQKRKADDISKDAPDADKKDDVIQVAEEVAAAAAEEVTAVGGPPSTHGDTDGGEEDGSKRRFFPRVKLLMTTEYEPFLNGVLDALEESGASRSAAASHKLSNPWYKAFHMIYSGVASDCSVPHGKNRYHKFKDKIVELWQAIEANHEGNMPSRPRALAQLEDYRRACAAQPTTPRRDSTSSSKALTPATAPPKVPNVGMKSFVHTKWEHLDEEAALKSLPPCLNKIVHLRNMVLEMGTSKTAIEAQYDNVMRAFLTSSVPEDNTEALLERATALAYLSRQAQSHQERKDITEAFDQAVSSYVTATASPTEQSTNQFSV